MYPLSVDEHSVEMRVLSMEFRGFRFNSVTSSSVLSPHGKDVGSRRNNLPDRDFCSKVVRNQGFHKGCVRGWTDVPRFFRNDSSTRISKCLLLSDYLDL